MDRFAHREIDIGLTRRHDPRRTYTCMKHPSTFLLLRSSPKHSAILLTSDHPISAGGPPSMSFVRAVALWSCYTAAVAVLAIPSGAADKKPVKKEPVAETPSYYGPQPARENLDLTMYARIRE